MSPSRLLLFLRIALLNLARLIRDWWVRTRISTGAERLRIDPRAFIHLAKGCGIELSDGVSIGAFTVIIIERDPFVGEGPAPTFTVGRDTYIGEQNNIRVSANSSIGTKCLISQGVSLITSNHEIAKGRFIRDQPWRRDKLGVDIGDDVWIGTNAVILPGVRIGNGAVIAAGSVVTSDVAEGSVVAGVPAKVIRTRM